MRQLAIIQPNHSQQQLIAVEDYGQVGASGVPPTQSSMDRWPSDATLTNLIEGTRRIDIFVALFLVSSNVDTSDEAVCGY